jgi:DNA invertase Pin-like site-specific DNA recombinase
MVGIYCRTSKDSETSIEQQRKLGIQFSISHNLEYEIYEDEGVSGFKISDDDIDPFNNRPSFTSLINDIKSRKINQVWVYEHSRLSRNQYASAAIFNIFEKYNVELFENGKKLDLDDPQFQMMRQILDAISQYERHLIVNRTTRGLYNAIDKGTRGYSLFYGYKNVGKQENGKTKWVPVESKLNQIKFAYEKILKGVPLRRIILNLYDSNKLTRNELSILQTRLVVVLRHFEYTGYAFNYEGTKLYQQILNDEVENISLLNNEKYFVKSVPYPVELISIKDWFIIFEKLIINKRTLKTRKERSFKRASQGLATGIIECSECHQKFYNWSNTDRNKRMKYHYYKHHSIFSGKHCTQKPKTYRSKNINEIFKIFYFFNCIVFDNHEDVIAESLSKIRQEILLSNEKLAEINERIKNNNKQMLKFNKVIDSTEELDIIEILTRRVSNLEKKNEADTKEKIAVIIELEKLNEKYSGTEREKAYYNVKDLVVNFFNSNDEERRTNLLKLIKKCYAFNNYLLIDNGRILYLFDTNTEYTFEDTLLNNLDKDTIYKEHFIDFSLRKKASTLNEKMISNFNLNKKYTNAKYSDYTCREIVERYFANILQITYDISQHTNLIAFMSLRGIHRYNQ